MPKIVAMTPIDSIKPGAGSTVLPDGTILNPVPYSAVDILFDDGVTVQVERPLTATKVRAAHRAATLNQRKVIDGIAVNQVIPEVV